MTESTTGAAPGATTASSKAKTTEQTNSPFGMPYFEVPKFDLPTMEMPEGVRVLADKGVAQMKDTYDKAKVAAEKATDLLESTYATAAKGATDYNLKVIDLARTNTNTAFDCAHELLGVKSLSGFVELSTAQARKHIETMTAQSKELTDLAQKMTADIAEPLKSGVTNAFNTKFS